MEHLNIKILTANTYTATIYGIVSQNKDLGLK
jgi:hypothetical protein